MVAKKQEALKLHPSLDAQPLLNVLNIKVVYSFLPVMGSTFCLPGLEWKVFFAEKIVATHVVQRENVFDSVLNEDFKNI